MKRRMWLLYQRGFQKSKSFSTEKFNVKVLVRIPNNMKIEQRGRKENSLKKKGGSEGVMG